MLDSCKEFQKISLNKILTGVMSDLQIRIEESKAKILFDELPTIECEPMQMRQLLQNLLGNALKFRKADVAPVIHLKSEIIAADDAKGITACALLTVSDNGIGFDNQFKDKIFTIFQRLHSRTEYEGTGIGLATVRKIIERHGGSIDAQGELNVGAKFYVKLPFEQNRNGTAK